MNKDLSKINFNTIYFNQKDVEDFYSKALLNANLYKRITAYFSVGLFKYLKKGISEFIKNDGYMQLILSEDIDSETIKQINKGYSEKSSLTTALSKTIIVERINELCEQDDVNLFSYLIAVGKLDVKLVYKISGIVHDTFGIISDGIHNLVYIGSHNFTEAAAGINDEAFQVTIDWDNPSKRELNSINELNKLFENIWKNEKDDVITVDLPDPIITKMIEKIDYEEIKQYIKNPNYIRFDFNEFGEVILTSNIDMIPLLNYKNIGEFSTSNFLSKEEKCFKLKNIKRITELMDFKLKIEKLCNNNSISFYLTKKAKDYFDLHYRNYDELSVKGTEIKKTDYTSTSDFASLKAGINSLIKRPLKDSQLQSAIHLVKMEKSLNFSVPGSGKTATVLGAFEYLANECSLNQNYVDKLLVIGRVNCAKSWKDEYNAVSFESDNHAPLCLINNDSISEKSEVLLHDYST